MYAASGFIGDTGIDWSTTSAVDVRAGHERTSPPSGDSRRAIEVINGSGLDVTGQQHNSDQTKMWLSQAFAVQGNPPNQRGGTVAGGHWIEFAFDQVYPIENMLIWNYAEIFPASHVNPDGSRSSYQFSAQGLRSVTIQYTTVGNGSGWGSNQPSDWQTAFAGDLDVYDPGEFHTAHNDIPFGGASARYVVVTSSDDPMTMNWVAEKLPAIFPNLDAGLSEVRFYPITQP
jgi:hypothetical protein